MPWPTLVFQRVAEPKVGKARIHLDLVVTDLVAATRRAIALGAWIAEDPVRLRRRPLRSTTIVIGKPQRVIGHQGELTRNLRSVRPTAAVRCAKVRPAGHSESGWSDDASADVERTADSTSSSENLTPTFRGSDPGSLGEAAMERCESKTSRHAFHDPPDSVEVPLALTGLPPTQEQDTNWGHCLGAPGSRYQ